jgi:hypothetical protein
MRSTLPAVTSAAAEMFGLTIPPFMRYLDTLNHPELDAGVLDT